MRYTVNKLKPLYQLPIEKTRSKVFDRTWYGRELVGLLDGIGEHSSRNSAPTRTSALNRTSRSRPATAKLPSDPGLVREEYYVRRVGFDRFLLLQGEYFNLNAEIPAKWHDLRSLVTRAA